VNNLQEELKVEQLENETAKQTQILLNQLAKTNALKLKE
jgi:hypothetical protein